MQVEWKTCKPCGWPHLTTAWSTVTEPDPGMASPPSSCTYEQHCLRLALDMRPSKLHCN